MLNRTVLLFFIVTLISGCATQGVSTQRYVEPPVRTFTNEVIIEKPYSQVWDALVKQLSKSFYVINNIDKESRIINVSFVSTKPDDFIDCGRTYRTYTQGDNIERYEYETASKSRFKVATPNKINQNYAGFILVQRDTSLDGRSNIYVAPNEGSPNVTTVTVNARYILTIKVRQDLYGQHVNGSVHFFQNLPGNDYTVALDTKKPESIDFGADVSGTCLSRGILEKEILRMAKQ
jgi:hypothetical protein